MTTRVMMKAPLAGPHGTASAGDAIALPDDVAREMIEGGYADALPDVEEFPLVEALLSADNARLAADLRQSARHPAVPEVERPVMSVSDAQVAAIDTQRIEVDASHAPDTPADHNPDTTTHVVQPGSHDT